MLGKSGRQDIMLSMFKAELRMRTLHGAYCKLKAAARNKINSSANYSLRYQILARGCAAPDCTDGCFLELHHPDYQKPLDVVPLCKSCHHRIDLPKRTLVAREVRFLFKRREEISAWWRDGGAGIPPQILDLFISAMNEPWSELFGVETDRLAMTKNAQYCPPYQYRSDFVKVGNPAAQP